MCLIRSGTPFSTVKLATPQGVWTDIGRLKEQGFELHKLKNSWSGDQYKGLNSQWIEPDTGQRFEVQFHTRISFEAKQLTHDAYERLRARQADKPIQADKLEQLVLEAFQRKVTGDVPVPPGATIFLTTRREAQMPDKVTYYAVVDDLSSRERPAGVFRRIYTADGGRSDEAFTRDLIWEFSSSLDFRRARRPAERVHRDHRGRGKPDRGANPAEVDRRQQRLRPPRPRPRLHPSPPKHTAHGLDPHMSSPNANSFLFMPRPPLSYPA